MKNSRFDESAITDQPIPQIVMFDFDGVIVDSLSTAFEVRKKICPTMTVNDYLQVFEGNINDESNSTFVHDEYCRHDVDFFTEYVPLMEKNVKMIPGIEAIVKELAKSYTLVIISSTISTPIVKMLEKLDIKKYFKEIMGNDVHKSKVEKIKMVLGKYQVNANQCVFITDTLGDLREAEIMKIGSIAVTWGFHPGKTLERGKSFRIIDRKEDLIQTIKDYFDKVCLHLL